MVIHVTETNPYEVLGSDICVVSAQGEIDLDTAPALCAALMAAVRRRPLVCCDLSGVTFCCAAGVGVLVGTAQEAARVGHRFHIRGAHGVTAMVLRITGVEDFLSGEVRDVVTPQEQPSFRTRPRGPSPTFSP